MTARSSLPQRIAAATLGVQGGGRRPPTLEQQRQLPLARRLLASLIGIRVRPRLLAVTAVPRVTEPRDVPLLSPDSYRAILLAMGKETSAQNQLAVAEYAGQMLTLIAVGWFEQTGDVHARRRFDDRFLARGRSQQNPEAVPDDMIDFLWEWRSTTHQALRQWVRDFEEMLMEPQGRGWQPAEQARGIRRPDH